MERYLHANTKNKPITPNDVSWPQEGPYGAFRQFTPSTVTLPRPSLIPHTNEGDFRVPRDVPAPPARLPVAYYQPHLAQQIAQAQAQFTLGHPHAGTFPVNEGMLWQEWKKPGVNYLAAALPDRFTPGANEPPRWMSPRGEQGMPANLPTPVR